MSNHGQVNHTRLEFFDERQLDLQQELLHPAHAALISNLKLHNDIDIQLSQLAADLEIILDGYYDRNDLCRMLCDQLKKRRVGETRSVIEIPR